MFFQGSFKVHVSEYYLFAELIVDHFESNLCKGEGGVGYFLK